MGAKTAILTVFGILAAAQTAAVEPPVAVATEGEWRPLFNGRNLDGWIPKINHRPLGDNDRDMFVVQNGVLQVSYKKFDRFTDEYAHLFYQTPFSKYRLRLDYRFVGAPTPGAQDWAKRNSGVMIHAQPPQTMGLNQAFPISVEVQFLGGQGDQVRPTANICSPGTVVSIEGKPVKEHCHLSGGRTYPDNRWVHVEIEVHGAEIVRHAVDGRTVLEYGNLRLEPSEYAMLKIDPADPGTQAFLKDHAQPAALDSGYIALQGESTPVEFRRIEIMVLRE